MVEQRSPKPRVESSSLSAPAKQNDHPIGWSFCLPAAPVGSKRAPILPLYQSARWGVTVRWTVTLARREPREKSTAIEMQQVSVGQYPIGWSFCLSAAAVGSKRTPISRSRQSGEMGSDSPVDCHVSERRAGESGAAPPVAEAASRFQGSVPMAAPRIGTGIGRHDEGR